MRNEIYKMVDGISPLDELEIQHRQNVLRWIESGAGLFRIVKPATPPKHLVSYFVVVDPDERRILLVDHLKAQLWLPTGGHVDVDENPRSTVLREAKEELSITASFLVPDPVFVTETVTVGLTAGHTDVSLWFLIKGNSREEIVFDPSEFKRIKWFSFQEVLETDIEKLDPHMHRFMRKWTLGV
jgi:8-oxo-dGTP pyrophosphatase MutT (NUDIX family)